MRLPRKHPAEIKVVTLPFGDDVPKGRTLLSVTLLSIAVVKGADPSPALVLEGDPLINQTTLDAFVRVKGGLDQCDYAAEWLAIDSDGQRHVKQVVLPVRVKIDDT